MKKSIIFFFVLFAISLISCESDVTSNATSGDVSIKKDHKVVVMEGCEYIIFDRQSGTGYQGYGHGMHKGNCINPIHCHNK